MVALLAFLSDLPALDIWAIRSYYNEYPHHYSNSTISVLQSIHPAASAAFALVEKIALCFWDDAQ